MTRGKEKHNMFDDITSHFKPYARENEDGEGSSLLKDVANHFTLDEDGFVGETDLQKALDAKTKNSIPLTFSREELNLLAQACQKALNVFLWHPNNDIKEIENDPFYLLCNKIDAILFSLPDVESFSLVGNVKEA